MDTIERNIYFFRVDAGLAEDDRPKPFDPCPTLEHIDSLKWEKDQRYWIDDTGRVTCCWVDQVGRRCRLRLGLIRRDDLPQVEAHGVLEPLGIPRRSGLAEQMHVVFFDDGIVGCDFNFYGPRITRLAHYLLNKAPEYAPPMLQFNLLLRRDVEDQLARFGVVSLFRLRVRRPFASAVRAASRSLGAAFDAAFNAGNSIEAEVLLKADLRTGDGLADRLMGAAARLLHHPQLHNEVGKFYMEGYDADTHESIKLDLLNDKLITKRSILKEESRTRALNSDSAYAAIESAYDELSGEFPDAMEVLP